MNGTARIAVIGLIFATLLGALTLRLWSMQVTGAEAYEARAELNQVRVVSTPAPRGDIFDINMVKLAGTRSALAAVVDFALVDEDEEEMLARNLSAFLNVETSSILEQFDQSKRPPQVTVATDLTEYQATFIAEHRETFPGVNIIPQPVRIYPEGEVAAHILGYIGRPNDEDLLRDNVKGNSFVGKAGVERFYDDRLLGVEGLVQYQVNARDRVLSLANEEAPIAGGSLVLTIDSEVQKQLQNSLRDGLIQARLLEMEERRVELSKQSIQSRLDEATAEAEAAAREAAREPAATEGVAPVSESGVDDDDVATDVAPVEINEAEVLASLYRGLPVDSDGVCVPVQRVTIPLGGAAVLSGLDPRFIRLESVAETDGVLFATVAIGSERATVKDNQHFWSTLQVLEVQEDRVILYHGDDWCPVRSVGVVLDPRDGSIIAMSSYPTYDPAVFVDGLSDDQWAALSTVSAFQNFAIQGLYAPASAFKTVPYILAMEEDFYPLDRGLGDKELTDSDAPAATAAVALESDTDGYNCSGEFVFALNDGTTQTKRDWLTSGHGELDLHGALVESCDLYFWDVALRLWEERNDESGIDKENLLQEYARKFGFGTATGVDLPFERDGLVPDRAWFQAEQSAGSGRVRENDPWVGGDLMDIAVGQGATLTTPLQMASGYAAMVNGGTLFQPRVVSHIIDANGAVIETVPTTVIRDVGISPATTQWLKADLRRVVNDVGGDGKFGGTAKSAFYDRGRNTFGPNVELIGGKTGTGEVIKDLGNEAYREVDNAWFMGVAPIDNPRFVISVVVERGGSGGRVAAPIGRQVLQYLLNGPDGVTELAPGLDAD
jgi:cell division protein FtsI/penicillin-binding protein 2